ncbi:MAG: HipA domain-containing protein [Rikenellaceae bacterium]
MKSFSEIDESFTTFDDNPALRELTMQLASSVAVLTLPHELYRTDDGGMIYGEKSIDKDSMRMIMDEEEYRANGSYEQIADLVAEVSTISKLDVLNFWEQVIFCWVAGCSDMGHLQFSMHEPHRGLYALTPASEFLPMAIIRSQGEGAQNEGMENEDMADKGMTGKDMALTINRKRHNITRQDFETAMKQSGLKAKIINGIFARYTAILPTWNEIIDSSYIGEELIINYKEFVAKRVGSL